MDRRDDDRPSHHEADRSGADTLRLIAEGRDLFASGSYYEAHEVWEDAWRMEAGEVRLLLQALTQMAAGFVKGIRDSRPSGAAKLFEAALEKMALLPDEVSGVPVREVREQLALAAEAARRWRDGKAERLEALPPVIGLRVP